MKKAFFVSDLHLKSEASPSGEAFLSLLKLAQRETDYFVILGDLFDLWVGPGNHFQKKFPQIVSELKKLTKTAKVLYFEGNHDIHLQKFWQNEIGIEVHTGPLDTKYGGLKLRMEHGDEINREDHGYLFLRRFLRTPPLRFLSESVPSGFIDWIGQRASKASRTYTGSIENKSKEIFRKYAEELRKTKAFDLLVVGHNHILDDYKFENSRMINLGSWFDGPKYLELSKEGPKIRFDLPPKGQ